MVSFAQSTTASSTTFSVGDGNTFGPFQTSIAVQPQRTNRYTLQSVVDAVMATQYNTDSDTLLLVVVDPLPQPLLIGGNTAVCLGPQTYSISATGATVNWQLSGGGTLLSQGILSTVAWNTAGSYVLTALASNFCGSSGPGSLSIIVSTIPAKPTISVSNSVQLTSSLSTGNQWYLNGALIPNATSTSYTALTSGTYTVRGQNQCGTGQLSDPSVVVITALDPPLYNSIIYPNPAESNLTVRVMGGQRIEEVSLHTIQGQLVLRHQLPPPGVLSLNLPLDSSLGGIYFLTIQTKQQTKKRKIIIYRSSK